MIVQDALPASYHNRTRHWRQKKAPMTPTTLADLEKQDNVLYITNRFAAWKQICAWFKEQNDSVQIGAEHNIQHKELFEESGKTVSRYWLEHGDDILYVVE